MTIASASGRFCGCCLRSRLTFGVPLEDVFPNGDIHPSLKNLFADIFDALSINTRPIKSILRNVEPIPDKIFLEEALTLCKPIDFMPAGTLLWMLRYFLGCLPISLLPKYTNGKDYVWLKISERCKFSLERYLSDRKRNDYLIDRLAEEFLRLPSVNLLLIGYLVNFLRSLIIYQGKRQRINKSAAFALVKYFSSSIFVRPFSIKRRQSRGEKLYHPLMLYILVKWPEIQTKCMEKQPTCFVPFQKRVYSYYKEKLTNYEDSSTQTTQFEQGTVLETIEESALESLEEAKLENEEDISNGAKYSSIASSDSFVTLSEVDYLKDFGSQTDNLSNLNCFTTKAKPIMATAHTQTSGEDYDTEINFLDGTYRNYDTSLNYPDDLNKSCMISINNASTQTVNNVATSTFQNKATSTSKIGNIFLPTLLSGEEYIYDDYRDFRYDDKPTPTDDTKLNIVEIKIADKKNPLMERLSKIGWTYTHSKENISSDLEESQMGDTDLNIHSSQIGWKIPKDNYKLCFEQTQAPKNKSLVVNDDTEPTSTLPSSTNLNNPDFCEATNIQTPLNSIKSKKSLLNFGKLKAKIDFVKIFKDRKLATSASAEQIASKIKYQKMTTARSTLF